MSFIFKCLLIKPTIIWNYNKHFRICIVLAGFVCILDKTYSYQRGRILIWHNAFIRFTLDSLEDTFSLVIKGDGLVYSGCCQSWAGSTGLYKKEGWGCQGKEIWQQHHYMLLHQFLPPGFCPVNVPILTSLVMNSNVKVEAKKALYSPTGFWSCCFVEAIETLNNMYIITKNIRIY